MQQEKLAAIGRVAAGVAHEVRNPLGVIRASAAMVQESFEREEDPYRACRFICEEIDRLNSLITALLTFSRPAELRRERVNLEKVIDRAAATPAMSRKPVPELPRARTFSRRSMNSQRASSSTKCLFKDGSA